ncbi:MAG TPA: hypothetical protein VGM50_11240, partial [Gemmatimonadaceae bacterium]
MTTPAVVSGAAEGYVAAFDQVASEGAAPAVQALRRAGFERFAALGFPTTKNEDWHFTSVAPIAEQEFIPLTARSGDV